MATADTLVTLISVWGLRVLAGLAILIAGWAIAGRLSALVARAVGRSKRVDDTLKPFLTSVIRYLVLAVTGLAVLGQLGVQTASLLAVFGAAGLAIGLAMQGTLSNLAAGVMLLAFRPFKVGDYVEAGGVAGTVKGITLFTTEFATPDNVQIIAPNAAVWGTTVTNYSHHSTRRLDLGLSIAYGDSIDTAMATIHRVLDGDARCQAEPPRQVAVGALGESSVDIVIRVWCQASDYWGLKFDLTRALKEAADEAGLTIPFPQREVWLRKVDPA